MLCQLGKKVTKYSSMAWIFPAIFIMVCVTLDLTETTFDIYGTTCWLSTGKAVLYLFILPAAVIMLFNITTFIKTALALCYNNNSQILHNNRKQNLIACTKLATLVGFPWLFAFFDVIFPDIEALNTCLWFSLAYKDFILARHSCSVRKHSCFTKTGGKVGILSELSIRRNETFEMSYPVRFQSAIM